MSATGTRRGAHRSALRKALVLPVVAALAVPALATSAEANHQRTVGGNAAFRTMDYESVGRNERCNGSLPLSLGPVEVGKPRDFTISAKCGGEIRVEVHFRLTHQQGGFIRVTHGSVELYEGTSASTTDRDGVAAFGNEFLFPGQSTTKNVHVQNWNEGQPDDKADVTLTLRNP
ncbi:hypothetical protein [Streptomyces sp. NPDC000983]|uniref:hypothetical protein n=1 Tax=Streptomyces sp. NPDC000983 TaxID=3154373 RepID=UPI0033220BA6